MTRPDLTRVSLIISLSRTLQGKEIEERPIDQIGVFMTFYDFYDLIFYDFFLWFRFVSRINVAVNSDKNLVDGRRRKIFNIQKETASMDHANKMTKAGVQYSTISFELHSIILISTPARWY